MTTVYLIGKSKFAIDQEGKTFLVLRLYRGQWLLEGRAPTEEQAKILLLDAASAQIYEGAKLSEWQE